MAQLYIVKATGRFSPYKKTTHEVFRFLSDNDETAKEEFFKMTLAEIHDRARENGKGRGIEKATDFDLYKPGILCSRSIK